MRIGLFTDTYTPEVNGVVTVLSMMRRELMKKGHEVFVFCPSYPGWVRDDAWVVRFRSTRLPVYQGMRIALPFSRTARPILPTLDIIHSQDPGPLGLLALWASERRGIPHVHTYHDLYMDYRRYIPGVVRPSPEMVKRLSRMFSHRCNAVIAPSVEMQRELAGYGIRTPMHALPFGVDEDDFSQEHGWDARAELGLPTEDILLYAGRVAREKNLEFLVRAFERIVSVRPRTRLVIAGDGPYRTTLEASVREWGLEELVIFTGFLNRSDLISFYQQATLFVFPSMTDTQGLVVMEAMMAGAAVVAVNVLGPVDVIQNGITGVLANPTVHEFSAACLCLLDDRETRRRMGGAARRWARNHSSRNSAEKLMEIYRLAGAKH